MKVSRATCRWALPLAAGVLLLGGCGEELVVGGGRDVEVHATGAAPGTAAGTVTFTAAVRLVEAGGQTAPSVPETRTATVRVDGADTVQVAAFRGFASRSYQVVRLTMRDVQAQVTGLVTGGGEVSGTVRVGTSAGAVIIVDVPVSIPAGTTPLDLLVELNAGAWLAAADPVTLVVPPSTFADAVSVRMR